MRMNSQREADNIDFGNDSNSDKASATSGLNVVTWDGDDDPEMPLNWSKKRKYRLVTLVALITLMPGLTSSICSPVSKDILGHFDVHNRTIGYLNTSIMLITWGFSGAIMAPLSEVIGRKNVFLIGSVGGAAFDFGCAYAPNMAAMLVFRGLSGAFNVVPLVIGAGCMADMFVVEERLWPLAWWGLGPSMGPVLGPIIGSFIAQWASWRWTFLVAGISQAGFGLAILLFFKEIYTPVLLNWKCQKLRKETGNNDLHTIYEMTAEPFHRKMMEAITRPIIFLCTNPIVFGLGFYIAFIYALMFLILTTYYSMWESYYGYQQFTSGLMYIGLGVGLFMGTLGWTYTIHERNARRKREGKSTPEDNLFYLPLAGIEMCIGTFWYGWSAQSRVHWVMEQIGMALFGGGTVLMFQTIQPYVVMLNPRFASSAIAALVLFRCELASAFPLFGQAMYDKLGYGWASTLIALLIVAIGVPYPIIVIRNGPRMRRWIDKHTYVT